MLTALLWIAWLTFATGEAFGVAALSREECEVKTRALETLAAALGDPATRTPCVRVRATVEEED